ncbi:MAG: alpha/beta hydrolase [Actinomycetota bacterium]
MRAEGRARRGPGAVHPHRRRNVLIGATLLGAFIPPIAARVAAERLRRRPDPERGESISEPMGEEGRYVPVSDGVRLYVEELGNGPTVVLVHGWFCNTDMWHYQKKLLRDRFRLVCFDQRGHCRSACPDSRPVALDTLAGDLKTVLDSIDAEGPVVLAGHSMGGISILKFTEMFGEELGRRVAGVALIDTSHMPMHGTVAGGGALRLVGKPLVEPAFRWAVEHPRLSDGVKRMVIGTSPFLVATRYLGYGSGASLTQMEYITEMAGKTTMKGASQAALGLLEIEEPISLEPLRASGIPVLIWVGEKDKLTRPRASVLMAAELPGSELHVIPDTGHPSYMEEYRLFNEVLESFCAGAFAGGERDPRPPVPTPSGEE